MSNYTTTSAGITSLLSFGLKGFTINSIDQIQPTLKKAIDLNESVLIEYNMSLEINTSTTTIEELQN